MNELEILSREFDEINILPLNGRGNLEKKKELPKNVFAFKPVFTTPLRFQGFKEIKYLLSKHLYYYLKDFFRNKVFLSQKKFVKWIMTVKRIQTILKNKDFKKIVRENNEEALYYFYWGIGLADIIPFLNNNKHKKVIVRLHGFDLYNEINDGYIPFRLNLLEHITLALPCSNVGVEYMKSNYPEYADKFHLQRVGVKKLEIKKNDTYKANSIVSVSNMVKVKRLDLLIKALALCTTDIEWTHFGDGLLRKEIEEKCKSLPSNIKVNLRGHIDSSKIIDELRIGQFGLFVNVSESEGVPVSIMEAFALGIPALATDAGGTKEIVDQKVGKLVPIDISPDNLAKEIKKLLDLQPNEWQKLSENAYQRYVEEFDLEKWVDQLIRKMKSI
ncbi:MAG: glycosyltransferase [Bacteroidetes bacterium]|nr:glycosyltransferase [Bacteroidota bacterium]